MISNGINFGGELHNKFGIILVLGLLFLSFSGAYAFKTKEDAKWDTNKVLQARKYHRRLGLIFWILSFLALTTGIGHTVNMSENRKYQFLFPIHAISMLLITFGNEALFRWKRKQEDKLVAAQDVIITEEEFEKRVKDGEKLCILDDIVLNLETYAYSHPGGAFLIEYTVGRDISKFFYGSYALDGNTNKPGSKNNSHAHSNIARKIANRHAIGYLRRAYPHKEVLKYEIDPHQTFQVNDFTRSFVFVENGALHQPAISGVQNYYSDLGTLGKHYHVVALDQNGKPITRRFRVVRRHYTIANCMRKEFYEALVNAVRSWEEDAPSTENKFDSSLLSTKEVNSINLTIKNYNLKSGLSHRFFNDNTAEADAHHKQVYQIMGPIGKGLGLTTKSEGTFLAFSAGTGVLVFIDLVAKMLLTLLNAPFGEDEEKLHDNFKLVFYASFQNKADSIALPLLNGLQTLAEKRGVAHKFQLNLRFSDEKQPRWDHTFIDAQLEKYQGDIKKIWVCGPPLMEEVFDGSLHELSEKYGLDFKT